MIEAWGRLPACQSVALRAVSAELSAVLIRMTAHAITRQTQIRAVQIFDLNTRTPGRWNVLSIVTFLAGYSRMFSFEWITRLTVVQGFAVRIPVNHIEIHAVMIGVALRALLARGIRPCEGGM